jgi:ubiquitin carboxyl-terminal hydrolase L3
MRLLAADAERPADAAAVPEQLYYMKQTIGNACGTIAMLHSIGNSRQQLQLGGCMLWICS